MMLMSLSSVSSLLLTFLASSLLMLSPAHSFSLQTFSDAQCSQPLPFSYFNASLNTNRTKACFPNYTTIPGAISSYYVYCSGNTSTNADYVDVSVDTLMNDSVCDHKIRSNIVWDVTSDYNLYSPTGVLIPQGVCTPVQVAMGGLVSQWAATQTAYAIVRCDAVSQLGVVSSSGGSAPSNDAGVGVFSAEWTMAIAMMIGVIGVIVTGQ
jgi:hypothetical protein